MTTGHPHGSQSPAPGALLPGPAPQLPGRADTPGADVDYSLALDEARRGFDQLDTEVTRQRERAIAIVGMSGLTAAFLGGLAIRDGAPLTAWTWVAVAAFSICATSAVIVNWRLKLHATQDPLVLIDWADSGASASDMTRELARHLDRQYRENRRHLDRRGRYLTLAVAALPVQILALAIDLWSR